MNTATRQLAHTIFRGTPTLEKVKELEAQGASLVYRHKQKGDIGFVTWCLCNQHFDIVEYLVGKGLDINDQNKKGFSAMSYLVFLMGHHRGEIETCEGFLNAMEWLMAHGGKADIPYGPAKQTPIGCVEKWSIDANLPELNEYIPRMLEIMTRMH